MGQKTNPNIFRLGINKTWKTRFFEKKTKELAQYIFQDLEVIAYIERVMRIQGIYCHNYQIRYNAGILNIYISYFLPLDIINQVLQINKINLLTNKYDTLELEQNLTFSLRKKTAPWQKVKSNGLQRNCNGKLNYFDDYRKKFFRADKAQENLSYKFQNVNLSKLNEFKIATNSDNLKLETKLVDFLIPLNNFLKSTQSIIFTLNCVNDNLDLTLNQSKLFKKNIMFLQKFRNIQCFKSILNACFVVLTNQDSANLLASVIGSNFKNVKRHKPFINLLKRFFSLFIHTELSQIKGIKIMIKGRLNGAPRARHKTITIGNLPIQKLKVKIDYSQVAVHNSNGSYGIKVWIIENKIKMFLQPRRVKYKKVRKGKLQNFKFKSNCLKFGSVGIKAASSALISARQIESARRAIVRKTKRKGKIWLRIFPSHSVTSKPNESRMGKGKGTSSYWASKVSAGMVLFELCGIPYHIAAESLKAGGAKLPVKTKIFD